MDIYESQNLPKEKKDWSRCYFNLLHIGKLRDVVSLFGYYQKEEEEEKEEEKRRKEKKRKGCSTVA